MNRILFPLVLILFQLLGINVTEADDAAFYNHRADLPSFQELKGRVFRPIAFKPSEQLEHVVPEKPSKSKPLKKIYPPLIAEEPRIQVPPTKSPEVKSSPRKGCPPKKPEVNSMPSSQPQLQGSYLENNVSKPIQDRFNLKSDNEAKFGFSHSNQYQNLQLPENEAEIFEKIMSLLIFLGESGPHVLNEQAGKPDLKYELTVPEVFIKLLYNYQAKPDHPQVEISSWNIPEPDSETESLLPSWFDKFKQFINGELDQQQGPASSNNTNSEVSKSTQNILLNVVNDFMKGTKRTKRQLGLTSSIVTVIASLFQMGFNTFGSIVKAIFYFLSTLISYLINLFLP